MDFSHINRALKFNNLWFTRFNWIMPFIKSEILGFEVAIAQMGEHMFLINKVGELIDVIDNV